MVSLYNKLQHIIKEFQNKDKSLIIPLGLQDILNRFPNPQDEESLKMALRQFLSSREDDQNTFYSIYRFGFVSDTLDELCIRIAEEIVEENEPIIVLIKRSLKDTDIQYMDEGFSEITLQEFTEYTDDKGKRRLKNLTDFGLSDDRKRVISYFHSCKRVLTDEKTGFCDQTAKPNPLTAAELERLKLWQDEFGRAFVSYHAQATGLWVTDNFSNKTPQENTLLYELKLLQECLLNGGVTRNSQRDHNSPSGTIADMGIKRFYAVWVSLTESQREELCNLEFEYAGYSGKLGFLLYRIMWGGNALPLTPEIEAIVFSTPYVGWSCVEVQSSLVHAAISVSFSAYDLQQIAISPQPAVVSVTTILKTKNYLSDKLILENIDPRKYTNFINIIYDLRLLSNEGRLNFLKESVVWEKINNLLMRPEDLVSLLDVLSNCNGMEIFKRIDKNKFDTWMAGSILKILVKIISNQEKENAKYNRQHIVENLLPAGIARDFIQHLGIDTLSRILDTDNKSSDSFRLLYLFFDRFQNSVEEIYKNKSLFVLVQKWNFKSTYYSGNDSKHHLNALVKYQREWHSRFTVPKFKTDNEVLVYIADVFNKIVGFNKVLSGNWGTKGDSFALAIINSCTSTKTLTEMQEVLLKNLQELKDLRESTSLPTPNGGTAMRIIHCLEVVACRLHGIEQQKVSNLQNPANAPVANSHGPFRTMLR